MFKTAREWLKRCWWGSVICYLLLLPAYYAFLWAVIAPLGIPATFDQLPSFLPQLRIFYHIMLVMALASHSTLVFDLFARKRGWGGKNAINSTANRAVPVKINDPLMGWNREGDWIPDTSHDPPDLRVTNSDRGGILRKTDTWTDYEFEFETRIDRENTAWIIRAYDLDNYVMLQCRRDGIIPHYRRDGLWWREQETNLPRALPEGWFRVCIRVQEDSVSAFWLEEGHRTVLLERDLLGSRTVSLIACRPSPDQPHYVDGPVFMSYLRGGVGFRASGHESAYFRNITVRPITEDGGSIPAA
jgi:hypothetical protein